MKYPMGVIDVNNGDEAEMSLIPPLHLSTLKFTFTSESFYQRQ
jgi:hypothetical protein